MLICLVAISGHFAYKWASGILIREEARFVA